MNYNKIREWLSEQERIQWEHWSKSLANLLESTLCLISKGSNAKAQYQIQDKLVSWKKNWISYKKLSEELKDFDREWADKILDNLPFKCPIYQCGGIMITKERPYPKGKGEDDFPDGMVGDNQLPDLVCTNCKAVYNFDGFKNRPKLHKPEVVKCTLSQNNKKEDGIPPTNKLVGILPKRL